MSTTVKDRRRGYARAEPHEGVPEDVGRVLRLARERRGWSVRELARRADLPNTYVSQVERGVIRRADPAALWTLSSVLGLDFIQLAAWSGQLARDEPGASALLKAMMQAFAALPPEKQVEVLRYVEELGAQSV